ADKSALVAAEAFETNDADRPGANPGLADQPCCRRVGRDVTQAFEGNRAAEADERACARTAEPECAKLGGRVAAQAGRRGSSVEAGERGSDRPNDSSLDLACASRRDQLSAQGTQQCLRDRRAAKRPQPSQRPDARSQKRI